MRFSIPVLALAAAFSASAATAAPLGKAQLPADPQPTLVDRLFPETSIEGEGWRGLLPIYLMNNDADTLRMLTPAKREASTRR